MKLLREGVRVPTAKSIEKAKHDGAQKIRKAKLDYMKKIFRLCNPKYHPHLSVELDIHMRQPQRKVGSMTVDNLGILVGAQGVDIKRVLRLWNGSADDKSRYHFPDLDFTRAVFQMWLNRRAWWEQVRLRTSLDNFFSVLQRSDFFCLPRRRLSLRKPVSHHFLLVSC